MTNAIPVILDTDIGTDVDDALALAMLLGSDDLDLLGVTCVYGDTDVRARLATRLLRLGARPEVPVYAGTGPTRTGRAVFWAGHEAERLTGDDAGGHRGSSDGAEAVRFLTETVLARPGEVTVLAVGPLTNVAAAIEADTTFASDLGALVLMGGAFADPADPVPPAEHNIACDPEAAAIVFGSGAPITVVGLDVTTTTWLSDEDASRFADTGALGPELAAQLGTWWHVTGKRGNVPHDPLAGLTITSPELFTFADWDVRVDLAESVDGPRPGATVTHAPKGPGTPVRVARSVQPKAAVDAIVTRIRWACR